MMRLIEQAMRFIFTLAIFCILSFAAIIYSGSANRWLTENLSEALTEATGLSVEIKNAHIEFPLKIAADSIFVSDANAPLLKGEQLTLDWNVQELLRGKFVVHQVDINALTVYQIPSSQSTQESPKKITKSFSLTEIDIQNFQLSEKIQTQLSRELQPLAAASWKIHGSCQLDENGNLKTAFSIQDREHTFATEGTAYGSFSNLDITANFQTSSISVHTISLPELSGTLRLTTSPEGYLGTVKTSALVHNIQTTVLADFIYASNRLDISEISLKTPYGNAQGHLLYSLDEKWIESSIQANLDIAPDQNSPFSGDATLKLNVTRNNSISIDLTSQLFETPHISLKGLQIDATIADITQSEQFTAYTSVKEIITNKIPLKGLISANGTLEGLLSAPRGRLEFSLQDITSTDESWTHIPSTDGSIQCQLSPDLMSYQGQLISSSIPSCKFSGTLPISLSLLPLNVALNHQKEIATHLNIAGSLESTLQLFFPEFSMLSGSMTANAEITGSLEAPQYRATMEIKEGIFEVASSGTVLKNIAATIESNGETATLTHLQATDGSNGKVSGRGGFTFDSAKNYPFSIDFDVENSLLWQQDYTSASFTGNLTFSGTTLEGKLSGSTTCTNAEIVIPDHAGALVDTIEVTYINQPLGAIPPPILIAPSAWPLAFDIFIQAPSTISIVGQELDSVWKGKLTIAGNTNMPLLFGDFKVVEGYYMFNGKNFTLDQGTISIAGEVDKKTTLYVIAAKDLGKVKVEVIMKGSVKNPEISFRSNPPMSQREILSWILFNRGSSEISHFQGSQLRESITNLSNTHKGPDVLTKIRNALGIDRIEICKGDGDSRSMGVQVGKYISQNVFVSVNKSDVNRLAVEATLAENIKLEADICDNEEGNLMLKWKRDY